jgi:hypothetical protein
MSRNKIDEDFYKSIQKKEYVIGEETPCYILTRKLSVGEYKVMVVVQHRIVDETIVGGYGKFSLTPAKREGIKMLYDYNRKYLNLRDVNMVHYKEDRRSGKKWMKEKESLEELFKYRLVGGRKGLLFPKLELRIKSIEREFYNQVIIDSVVYFYLFKSNTTHKWIEENVMGIKNADGYTSQSILHSFGLRRQHHSTFFELDIVTAISILKEQDNSDGFSEIISVLERIIRQEINQNEDVKKVNSSILSLIDEPLESIELSGNLKGSRTELIELDVLRERAIALGVKIPNKKEVTTTVYERNQYVALYAKKKANGICQLCEQPAPFADSYGEPYLEEHHIKWLSKGGEDTIENTIALCPNCHKKVHILNNEEDVKKLIVKANNF